MMCLCESFHLRFQSGKLLPDLHLLGINVPENVIRVSIQLCDDLILSFSCHVITSLLLPVSFYSNVFQGKRKEIF